MGHCFIYDMLTHTRTEAQHSKTPIHTATTGDESSVRRRCEHLTNLDDVGTVVMSAKGMALIRYIDFSHHIPSYKKDETD